MNKKLKIALITFSSLFVIIVIAGASFFLKFKSETSKMSPVKTGQVLENIFAVQDKFVNLFIIKTSEGYIAIDGGYDTENIKQELKKLNISETDVKALFLTHSDSDHTAAAGIFKNAKIYASENEAPMLDGKINKVLFFSNQLNLPYTTMKDKEIVRSGGVSIRLISTPGHTLGSASYMVDDHYLFIGDTLSLKNSKIEAFNNFFNMDTAKEKNSIEKIKALPGIKYIITAHYGILKNF